MSGACVGGVRGRVCGMPSRHPGLGWAGGVCWAGGGFTVGGACREGRRWWCGAVLWSAGCWAGWSRRGGRGAAAGWGWAGGRGWARPGGGGRRAGGGRSAGRPGLAVGGLADADARAVLASVLPGRLDERVRDRIVAESGGNPLALLELPHGVTAAGLAGGLVWLAQCRWPAGSSR